MAIAFGAAVMVGVAAGLYGDLTAFLLMVGCFLALAGVAPRSLRLVALTSALGLLVGMVATFLHDPSNPPPPTLPHPPEIDGRIASDPRLTNFGQYAEFVWTDQDGVQRRTVLFYPASVEAGRGDLARVHVSERATFEPLVATRVEVISTPGRVEMFRRSIRAQATTRILSRAPGSNGSLALGLLIGDDSGLTPSEREHLRASGLSHITAVSGSNVAMVIMVVAFLLRALIGKSWIWVGLQLLAIVLYVWIVGAEPPIIRAAIMGSLALIAIRLGRPSDLFTLLALTGALMVLIDPEILSSLSFQLSFLAMQALGFAGLRSMRLEGRSKQIFAILASPIAAAVVTAPLIALRFGFFGLGTVPANVLVAPLIAPATGLSALTAILADVPVLGQIAGGFLWLATGMILEVSRRVGGFSSLYWTFPPPGLGATILIYMLILACVAPLLPEVRLAAYKLRRWSGAQPGAALSSAFASLVLLWTLASFSN